MTSEERWSIGTNHLTKRYYLLLVATFIVFFRVGFCFAQGKEVKDYLREEKIARWQITAKRLSYSEEEGVYVAEGDVLITRDGQVLRTQKAIYKEKTGVAEVSGGFRLEANGDVLTGEEGTFDLKGNTGEITKGTLFIRENNFYVSGDVVEKVGPNTYIVKGCRLTTCDGIKPDWSITGSEVKITIEGYGTVKHAAFRIRDLPVLYVPYALFPVKTQRQTGLLLPSLGYSNRNGMEVEIPFFLALSDQTDATFYERLMARRGLMQGLEFRYLADVDSKGTFLFDILSDRIGEKDLNDFEEVELSPQSRTNETRYWLRSRTDQKMPWGVTARLDTDFVSDQDYLKEFTGGLFGYEARPDLAQESGRPVEEIQSPTRRSALRVSRDSEDYSLQGLSSFYERPENPANNETPQPIAGLDFNVLPRSLPGLPLFIKFDTNYNYIWRDFGEKGHSFSFTPEVSYPMWFGRYVQFEPTISYTRTTQWLSDHEDIDQQSRDAYEVGARVSTLMERTFQLEWGNVKKLRHKFLPSLTYTFRAPKDEDEFRPWFEPIDEEGKINRVALSLDNFLDAKSENPRGEVSYAQWGKFSLIQGFDINEARRDEEPQQEKKPFEALIGILRLNFLPSLDLDAEAHWDHEEGHISFADLSLEFSVNRSGDRKDRYQIDYEFTEEERENLNYYVNVNLLGGFSAGTSLKRDIDAAINIESSYWLDYQSQCWGLRFITEKIDQVETFMVTFRLVGLGS